MRLTKKAVDKWIEGLYDWNVDFPYESEIRTFLEPYIDKPSQPDYFYELIPNSLSSDEFINKWKQWVDWRKEKRQTLKQTTAKLQLAKLARDPASAIATIQKSLEGGYTGLFPPEKTKTTDKWEKLMQ